jgi:geranylgeranyl diphosphate synthase type I
LASYEAYGQAIQRELKELFASRTGFLYDLLRYHLGWTNQLGQPVDNAAPPHFHSMLALGTCRALAGDFSPALPVAAAVELVHNFTLVHGDVQAGRVDAQERPSIWWVWGPAQAINAGDGLHALSRAAMMRLANLGVAPQEVLEAVGTLDRACLSLCEGQYMDLSFQDQLMVTSNDYYDMIGRKTGAVSACSTSLGALTAGADADARAGFQQLGAKLGMAWQISQDVADFWGQGRDGMTAGNLLNKKKSLPLIHALENSTSATKRQLGGIYAKRVLEPDDISQVISLLEKVGSRRFAEGRAEELVSEGYRAVAEVDMSPEQRQELEELGQLALGHSR